MDSSPCDCAGCKEPAHWADAAGIALCETHAMAELRAEHSVFGLDDGEQVGLDATGEIVLAGDAGNVWPKHHGCGAVITEAQWQTLSGVFVWEIEPGIVLENRLCPGGCGSHLAIEVEAHEGPKEAA